MKRILFILALLIPLFALGQTTPVLPSGPKQVQWYIEPSTSRLWGFSTNWYVIPDSAKVVQWAGSGTGLPSQGGNAGKFLTTNGTVASWANVIGGVTSVSGTTNRITSTGGTTPIIDISASYIGQTSITTVGTLSAGSIPYSLLTGTPSIPTSANPTATAGISFVNGSATTYMRSDAAPKVDSTVFQTVLNFFPKGDTRYGRLASSNTWTQPNIFTNGIASSLTTTNLFVPSATDAVNETLTPYNYNGASNGFMRIGFGGTTSTALTANSQYANVIVGSAPITTAATGTHNLFANIVINPIGTVTNSGSLVSQTANLYVGPPSSNIGSTNFSALFAGPTQISSNFTVSGNTSLAATTTATVSTIGNLSTNFSSSGQNLMVSGVTVSDLFTAAGTIPLVPGMSIGANTYSAVNNGITITNAPSLYIAGAPTGTNVTLTNPYSLYINSGAMHLPGTSGQYVAGDGSLQTYSAGGTSTLANALTFGTGLVAGSYNNSVAVTEKVDTTVMQTVLNLFPKTDTRYVTLGTAQTITGVKNFNQANLLATNSDAIVVQNTTASTAVNTVQNSPNIHLQAHSWNTTATAADNISDMRIWMQPTTGATTSLFNLRIDESANGGGFANILNLNSFSSLTVANYLANTSNQSTSTTTSGMTFANGSNATASVQTQNSANLIYTFGEWNTSGTPAANFSAWKIGGQGLPGATPNSKLVFSSSQTVTSTASYTDRVAIDAATGNITFGANSTIFAPVGAFTFAPTLTATSTPTFPTGAGTLAYLAGNNTWTGTNVFSHLVAQTATDNIYIPSTNSAVSSTSAPWLFGGASTIFIRGGFGSTSSTTLTTGASYANVVLASSPITTFTSGTHAILANFVVRPLGTITPGGATITDAVSGISYPSTGGSNNWNFWFKGGNTRVSGLQVDTLTASSAVFTDANKKLVSSTLLTPALVSSSAGTLTLSLGVDYEFTGTTTTWTLPAPSGTTTGRAYQITIKNAGVGAITLNSASGSQIYDTALVSSITITAGSAVTLMPSTSQFDRE